jgi:hypothetical protein
VNLQKVAPDSKKRNCSFFVWVIFRSYSSYIGLSLFILLKPRVSVDNDLAGVVVGTLSNLLD